ncbi:hypothetical protein [Ochrovirga pacifica]|uniref:hypothetical protein n=1 Tax=Ochrovirga pacifica TaxID=1042376 RepID=UPI000255A50A|nr:hypothetical protein [Ochrovirga pacifica]
MQKIKLFFSYLFILFLIGCAAKDVEGKLYKEEEEDLPTGSDIVCKTGGNTPSSSDLLNKNVLIIASGVSNESGSIETPGNVVYIDSDGSITSKTLFQDKNDKALDQAIINAFAYNNNLNNQKTILCLNDRIVSLNTCTFTVPYAEDESGNLVEIVVLEGLAQARDIVIEGNSAYITNWGINTNDGTEKPYIAYFNLNGEWPVYQPTNVEALNIKKPEKLIYQSPYLIANHIESSVISIVASDNNNLIEKDLNDYPIDLTKLSNGNIAVLCSGDKIKQNNNGLTNTQYQPAIFEITPSTGNIVKTLLLPYQSDLVLEATSLAVDDNTYYYALSGNSSGNSVYKLGINQEVSEAELIYTTSGNVPIEKIAVNDGVLYMILRSEGSTEGNFIAYDIAEKRVLVNENTGGIGSHKIYLLEDDFELNP